MNWLEWQDRLMWLLHGGDPNAPSTEWFIRGAMWGCTFFATLQFFTMLATRWGDRNASAKSFVLAIVVHLSLGLGWQTLALEIEKRRPPTPPSEEETPLSIQRVMLQEDMPAPGKEEGAVPVWQQTLDIPVPSFDRSQPVAQQTDSEQPTPRMDVDDPFVETEAPNLTTPSPLVLPEVSPQLAVATDNQSPRSFAAVDANIEAPLAEARTERSGSNTFRRTQATGEMKSEAADLPSRAAPARQESKSEATSLRMTTPDLIDKKSPRPIGTESASSKPKSFPAATPGTLETSTALTGDSDNVSSTGLSKKFQRQGSLRSGIVDDPLPGPATRVPQAGNSLAGTDRQFARGPSAMAPLRSPNGPQDLVRLPSDSALNKGPARIPETYSLRRLQQRRDIALKNGGTEASERAVEMSLRFLSKIQERDGRWDCNRHEGGRDKRTYDDAKPVYTREKDGVEADAGVTGLSILAFLGAGYTHEEGAYTENVERALRWLIQQQREDGYLGGQALERDQMYCHAIATYAIAEAYGMQKDPDSLPGLRSALQRGATFTCGSQYSDGGWRYQQDGRQGLQGDISIFGWHLMGLKSGELAGLGIPDETREGMIRFLRENSQGNDNGLMGYRKQQAVSPAMTAEALFCKQMFGIKRTNRSSVEAAEYLRQNLPRMSKPNDYYWYYGTLAMFQYGGEPWKEWNDALRDTLIDTQRKQGELAGSWDPQDPWGLIGGRIYSTALSTLCLEVYYRFLPLYRVNVDE